MPVLYIVEQGAKLQKDVDVFIVTKDDNVLQKIHAIEVEQIVLFGNISLTTPVTNYILEHGIDCVFCNSHGKFHGRLISTGSKFGLLRLKQLETILQPVRKLEIARAVIKGKLQNQRTLMMRYRREDNLPQLEKTVEALDKAIVQLDKCTDTSMINGVEGAAGASYYQSFQQILKQQMGFSGRIKRPPTDPVNSLLSFCYTLLAYNIQSAVSIVGMDPFLGFLHSPEPSRPSLALDLMEEFRSIIVDSLVLWLINTSVMKDEDFKQPEQPGKMVVIKPDSIKKVIHHYEQKVLTKIYHPRASGQTTYRHCFELQSRELANVLLGKTASYKPFLTR